MDRSYYIDLANAGLAMPVGSDLVLHAHDNVAAILNDGTLLGKVLEETAQRYQTPLAFPHMDLELEKHWILRALGVPEAEMPTYHFSDVPDDALFARFTANAIAAFPPHLVAHIGSVKYIAQQTKLLPIGMAIGPFSLMTKMVTDPITPIAMAGAGMTGEDDDDIMLVERTLELAITAILISLGQQIEAGAKAIFIAEPAANKVYLSPNQIDDGSDIFDRFVMQYNLRLKAFLDAHGVDLIFHCCGELTDYMLKKFTDLRPVMLSLGSSRKLWEDAVIVPKDIVLYGNLPSKRFYSDGLITRDEVITQASELCQKMREVGHPHILGSECDVLSVPGHEETISSKADALLTVRCGCACKK